MGCHRWIGKHSPFFEEGAPLPKGKSTHENWKFSQVKTFLLFQMGCQWWTSAKTKVRITRRERTVYKSQIDIRVSGCFPRIFPDKGSLLPRPCIRFQMSLLCAGIPFCSCIHRTDTVEASKTELKITCQKYDVKI